MPADVATKKEHLRATANRRNATLAAKSSEPKPDKTLLLLEAAQKYFGKLTPEEQVIVESNALAKGNRFQIESYHRLKAGGGKLFQAVRMDLIAKYLEAEQVFAAALPPA